MSQEVQALLLLQSILQSTNAKLKSDQAGRLLLEQQAGNRETQSLRVDSKFSDDDHGRHHDNKEDHYRNLQLARAWQLVGDGGEGIIET